MLKIKHILPVLILLGLIGASWPFDWLFPHPNRETPGTKAWIEREFQILHSQASTLDQQVLRYGLTAYSRAQQQGYVHKQLLTVIDYSKPSREKPLWVFDLGRNSTVLTTWASHGKNS